MSAAARPLVAVRKFEGDVEATVEQVVQPSVFLAPIRQDIVQFVHTNMRKNSRQPYAVKFEAGMGHSAESWGTGRAVSRIPRVSGGGTSRAGQGAFGNQCRKGRMFAPTKTWRRWHRKINTNQKRYAVASALAASALTALVQGRGHVIDQVAEIPLVVDGAIEKLQKTKQAIAALKALGAYGDVEKAGASRKIRRGRGKMRNRRHVLRRGPLVVYKEDNGIVQAFRNLPGVDTAQVDSLNLLQLAPGGHLGRFIIWTQGAFKRLNEVWGSQCRESTVKKGYKLPRPIISNSDVTRLINSDEVQTHVRAPIKTLKRRVQHKNPLKNFGARVKLNPFALTLRRSELLAKERRANQKEAVLNSKRDQKDQSKRSKVNYKRLTIDGFVPPKPEKKSKASSKKAAPAKVAKKEVAEKKTSKKPEADKPARKESAADKPARKESAADKPARKESAADKPARKESVDKPARKESGADAAKKGGKKK
jgi:large subunit ribosomal protein L4e